jgi:rubrerythrin
MARHSDERAWDESESPETVTRERLAELLNEDLAREYQAIIAYVVYSQVLKGAEYMNIADQLETHAHDESKHALIISRQIDYLGVTPSVTPTPVRMSDEPKNMLRFDLATRTRPYDNIAIASGNARHSASLPWQSKSARSSPTSRTIKLISPPPLAWRCRM